MVAWCFPEGADTLPLRVQVHLLHADYGAQHMRWLELSVAPQRDASSHEFASERSDFINLAQSSLAFVCDSLAQSAQASRAASRRTPKINTLVYYKSFGRVCASFHSTSHQKVLYVRGTKHFQCRWPGGLRHASCKTFDLCSTKNS